MKKRSLLFLLLFAVGFLSACSPNPPVGVDSSGLEPFVVGGIGPLTGEFAEYGSAVRNGAQMAADEINATGGINGFRLVLNFQDSKGDPDTAVTVYDKLKANEMKALLGGVFSAETAALAEKAKEDGILTLVPTAGEKTLLSDTANLFRICPDNRKTGETAAQFLTERYSTKRPAVIYSDDAFGNLQVAQGFLEACRKKNVFTTEMLLTAEMTETELEQVFSLLAQEAYDGIFLALPPEYLSAFFAAYHREESRILAVSLPRNAEEETAVISTFFPSEEEGLVRNFAESYETLYSEAPDRYAAEAYDAVYAIAESIRRSGLSPETAEEEDSDEKLIDAMTKISVKGVTGVLAWTTDGEPTRPAEVKICTKGTFTPDFKEDPSQKP